VCTSASKLLQIPPHSQASSVWGKGKVGSGESQQWRRGPYHVWRQRREQGHSLNAPEGKTEEKQAWRRGENGQVCWCSPVAVAIPLCLVCSDRTWCMEGSHQTEMCMSLKSHCLPGSHAERKMAGFVFFRHCNDLFFEMHV